jgi:hypothetical protein
MLTTLAGCTIEPKICGLKPIFPGPLYGGPLSGSNTELIFVPVDSLQPTLRWEPFVPSKDSGIAADNIQYDLRVWSIANGCPEDEVYARDGIQKPSHRFVSALKPATNYFWSVRARFTIAGQVRVSPWTLSQYPWRPGPDPCKLPTIPCDNYLRFRTPDPG